MPTNSVHHPSHYNVGQIEVIDFIEDQQLDFRLGNAIKYICRGDIQKGKGTQEQDIRKAIWYLERYLGEHKDSPYQQLVDANSLQYKTVGSNNYDPLAHPKGEPLKGDSIPLTETLSEESKNDG